MEQSTNSHNKKEPLNKGKLVGQKPPLKPKEIWAQYQDNYARHKSIQARLLCAFFRFYVPIYENLSLVAVRHDELKADRYACDLTRCG